MGGPIIIADKSFIEMLKIDESVWLDHFFNNNITPILYLETLADLKKENLRGRESSEHLVREIANKTPFRNAYPNVFHDELVIANLWGEAIRMVGFPVIRISQVKKGQKTLDAHIESFPEIEAQQKWQDLQFTELEKVIAKNWRIELAQIDYDKWNEILKNMLNGKRLKSLEEVKEYADRITETKEGNNLMLLFDIFNIPSVLAVIILKRYEKEKPNSINEFAPYAAYVFKVKLFFHLAVYCGHISKESSYKTDIMYLYYLPFCQIFVSEDISHEKMVPLFLNSQQEFVKGSKLKLGLKEINEHFTQFEKEIEKEGILKFALFPPKELDDSNELIRLWSKFCPNWREIISEANIKDTAHLTGRIEQIKKEANLSEKPIDMNRIDSILIQRKTAMYHGKWRILPPIEKKNQNKNQK